MLDFHPSYRRGMAAIKTSKGVLRTATSQFGARPKTEGDKELICYNPGLTDESVCQRFLNVKLMESSRPPW